MEQYEKNIIPHIESVYSSLTPLEKNIAKFFIKGPDIKDLSSKSVAARLFVSESSLSRFAKKCGFHGYREFIYNFEQGQPKVYTHESIQANDVLNVYQALLDKTYSLVDEKQMERIADQFLQKKRIYIYGQGSSAMACYEMKLRLLQIGINMDIISDLHAMKLNYLLLDSDCLVIGITRSDQSELFDALHRAKQQGASTILLTSHQDSSYYEFSDEVLLFAVKEHLDKDSIISPPVPHSGDLGYSLFPYFRL